LYHIGMDTKDLQAAVRRSHDQHFGSTTLKERMRDLQQEISEVVHHRDTANLVEEIGDAGWSLLQLCNEQSVDFSEAINSTIKKLDSRVKNKKVALIGTSANPITNAHLTMGLEILALTDVDEVWFYIAGEHPWGKKLMPAEHRLEMVRRAVAKYPKLKACDFDIVHGPDIYPKTMQTAEILRDYFVPAYPHHTFCWVMGSDVAQTFHKWGSCDWLAQNLNVFIIHRLGYDFDKNSSILSNEKHQYLRDNVVTSNISSTLVRERGREYDHSKLVALVPDVVWSYLEEHRLLDPNVMK